MTADEIGKLIKELVGPGQIRGSRLAQLLKVQAPDFRPLAFEVRSLREFIGKFVPEVVVAGRAGMDVVYSQGEPKPDVPLASAPSTLDLWRVWVSPNNPHAVATRIPSGELVAVPSGTASAADVRVLQSPTVDDHRAIARAFLEENPELPRARLAPIVEREGNNWWQAWLSELRGTEFLASWNRFRRERLENLLRDRLLACGLSPARVAGLLVQVHDGGSKRQGRGGPPRQADDRRIEQELRSIVIRAVNQMGTSELRELRIPLGLVLDALATPKTR